MNWTCADINERIDDYLDGLLSAEAIRGIEAHARQCDACAAELEAQCKLIGDLTQLGSVAECIAAAESEDRTSRSLRGNWGWLATGGMAAAIALALIAGYLTPMKDVGRGPSGATDARSNTRVEEKPPVRLVLADASRLVVPIPTQNEKVHIFWMYDVVQHDGEYDMLSSPPKSLNGRDQTEQSQMNQRGTP